MPLPSVLLHLPLNPALCYILDALMVRTVIVTGVVAITLLCSIVVINLVRESNIGAEYIKFALALAMFLVILLGSYLWIVRGPGRYM
jgi:hypothetical protein